MDIPELERALAIAQERSRVANEALRPKHKGGEMEAAHDARREVVRAERALSLAKGEETALECEWPAPWDTGATLPHVLSSGHRSFLVYLVNERDPDWDGSYATVVDSSTDGRGVATVEFLRCVAVRFGAPNDEVLHGHPLYGRGLEYYGAHTVANSRWLRELQQTNSVHRQYRAESWSGLKHYLLAFHDETYETIAREFRVTVTKDTVANAVAAAVGKPW